VINAAETQFDRLDILVNVAALTTRGNLLNTSSELFDRMIAINLRAPFFLMQHTAKVMRARQIQGSIINIGSISALAGQSFIAAYCASKGGLNTLTRNSAHALLPDRIRVNCLNIGWMDSEGEDAIQREHHGADDGWQQKAGKQLPFGRLVDPAEVARAIGFLASSESGLMTGSIINFDQTIWGTCADHRGSHQPLAD
jgi:NAD(P)-dependent dehydrogenase (short-subunit alcohol dehydrogenase family)